MAKLIYEKKFTLTTGMFDEASSIKPYALLDLFQKIAGDHADLLGIGSSYCEKNNYGWLLARQEVIVYNSPKPSDTVIITTFPHEPGKIEFKREYVIRTTDDNIIARGCALWVLVDFNTHRMLRSDNIYPEGEYVQSTLFKEKLSKPQSSYKEGILIDTYKVTKSDVDLYHHMNNAKYAEVFFNYLDYNADQIEYFAINYQNEIKENFQMDIYKLVDNNQTLITGVKNDTIIFTSSITKKEGN